MAHSRFFNPKLLVLFPVLALLLVALACGDDETATPVPTNTPQPAAATSTPLPTSTPAPSVMLPAFANQGKRGGIIQMLGIVDPDHWDLHQSCCAGGPGTAAALFSNLVQYNPVKPDEIEGDLAKAWELSSDNMSYTFTLNPAEWTDGQPVTAEDVKFSLDRMAEDKLRPRVSAVKRYIESVEVIDSQTVKVNLLFPGAPALLGYLAVEYFKILPKHWVESLPQEDPEIDFNPEEIVSSGPYVFGEYERGSHWEHTRNPNYFKDPLPFFDGIFAPIIRDNSRKAAAFRTGQVEFVAYAVTGLPTRDVISLFDELSAEWDIYWYPPTAHIGITLNHTKPPFDDERVRRAIFLAIDRQEVIEATYAGRGVQGAAFPAGTWFGASEAEISSLPGYRYVGGVKDSQDIDEAKSLLAAAGFPDGLKGIVFPSYSINETWSQLVKEQLKKIGVETNLEGGESAALAARYADGDFQMFSIGYGINIQDPDDIVGAFYVPGGTNNLQDWTNSEVISLVEEQSAEADRAARRAVLAQIEDIVFTGESHWVPVAWGSQWHYAVSKSIANFFPGSTLPTLMKHEHMWFK